MLEKRLLISCENGRAVKTYGPKSLAGCNMKITFLCIVALLSCYECASAELEIYPGANFFGTAPENQHVSYHGRYQQRKANNHGVSAYTRPFAVWNLFKNYHQLPPEDYRDELIREREQLVKDLWERAQAQAKNDGELPYYLTGKTSGLQETYEEQKPPKHTDSAYPFFPNKQQAILEDDDGIFTSLSNERTDSKNELDDDEGFQSEHFNDGMNEKVQQTYPDEVNPTNDVMPILEESTSRIDEFAYLPSDPRFFQKSPSADVDDDEATEAQTSRTDSEVNLTQRRESFRDDTIEVRKNGQVEVVAVNPTTSDSTGLYLVAVVAGISAAATVGLIAVGIGWYNLQKHVKNATDVEYPAYGVTGPNKDVSPSSGDRRLAQSAQMYHYQHQKQQIIAMESRAAAGDRHGSVSDVDSDEENEEGDYTVYECPGLAPTDEMEVKNPLFQDDPTPAAQPSPAKTPSTTKEEKK